MRSSQAFIKSYRYVLDAILLYIILFLLYIHTDILPPLLPFLLIAGGGALLIAFLLSIMKSNTPYLFIIIVVPLLALVGSEFGISFGVCLFSAAVVCYRVVIHATKVAKLSESILLNLSLLIGSLVYFAAYVQGYRLKDVILYLIVSQLLFLMIGKVLSGVMDSTIGNKDQEIKKQSRSLAGLFGGLFLASILLAVIFPIVVSKGLSFIFTLVGKGMYVISKPLFHAVDEFDSSSRPRGDEGDDVPWDKALEERGFMFSFLDKISDVNPWTILSIIGLLMLAILTFILARRRLIKEVAPSPAGIPFSTFITGVDGESKGRKRAKGKAPQVKVRKLVFDLEIQAAGKGLGRFNHESVQEWLSRNSFLDTRLVDLYEKVRYGDEKLSEQEEHACDEIVKHLKSQIKSLKKKKE